MNQYQTISAIKDTAKNKLTGKFGSAVLLTFANSTMLFSVNFIISMIISTIVTVIMLVTTGDITSTTLSLEAAVVVFIIEYLLTLLCSVFAGVFNTGVALFFLNIASGRTAILANLFYGFHFLFKKSLKLSAVTVLTNAICMLPYTFCSFMFTYFSGSWGVYMIVALLLGTLLYLPIQLSLSQAFFLLLDFPSRSAKELLQTSIRLMKGRKKQLFLIQLSFLPLMLLGTLSFEIGNLWITPYVNMVMALYFLDIMKPATSDNMNI